MTATISHDTDTSPEQPDNPPMSIAALVVGLTGLLDEAIDLPQPRYITVSDLQMLTLQFAPEQASMRAITRWALRFGSDMTTEPHAGKDGPETWYRTQFAYCDIAVTAYAHIPAGTASTCQS